MTELLKALTSPWNFLLVVLVFGLAPGLCLRVIVLAYPRDDPRREELIAELYGVPRITRPLWVAEQLEVALFEGLAHRVSAAIRRRTVRRRAPANTNRLGPGWITVIMSCNVMAASFTFLLTREGFVGETFSMRLAVILLTAFASAILLLTLWRGFAWLRGLWSRRDRTG
jgi:hypothetical protein